MNYYLFPLQGRAITSDNLRQNERVTIDYRVDSGFSLQVDDHVLLSNQIEQCILPYEFGIVTINRFNHTLTIRVAETYRHEIPLTAILTLLSDSKTSADYIQLSRVQVEALTSLMDITLPAQPALSVPPVPAYSTQNNASAEHDTHASTSTNTTVIPKTQPQQQAVVIFDEDEVLEYMKDYIRDRGYYFEDETLYNYHICLKTRPFVILAGLSGTGKSKLAQLYAEALGQGRHFKRLAVRPNWNDDRYLLGYLNTLTGEYITEPAVELIMRAIADPYNLYSICLDEMNLARVEYYFSQFLSAMEEERPEKRRISLLGERALKQLQRLNKDYDVPAEIYLPENLLITGTINVDESTQSISDKVIDRANTIEFFNVDLDKMPPAKDPEEPLLISAQAWLSYRVPQPDTSYRSNIVEINKILKDADMGFGYRTVREIEAYLANSKKLLSPQIAFDLQVKQRILPHINGTEVIKPMLLKLIDFSKSNALRHTEKRLDEMKNRLERDGYTSFWR